MADFFDVAAPVLDRLTDDPDRGAPRILNPTTMPLEPEEIRGEILRVREEPDRIFGLGLDDVDPENVEAGRRVLREAGIDVLAFYKSFRFRDLPPYRGRWGIFLIDAGGDQQTWRQTSPNPSDPWCPISSPCSTAKDGPLQSMGQQLTRTTRYEPRYRRRGQQKRPDHLGHAEQKRRVPRPRLSAQQGLQEDQ